MFYGDEFAPLRNRVRGEECEFLIESEILASVSFAFVANDWTMHENLTIDNAID